MAKGTLIPLAELPRLASSVGYQGMAIAPNALQNLLTRVQSGLRKAAVLNAMYAVATVPTQIASCNGFHRIRGTERLESLDRPDLPTQMLHPAGVLLKCSFLHSRQC